MSKLVIYMGIEKPPPLPPLRAQLELKTNPRKRGLTLFDMTAMVALKMFLVTVLKRLGGES